MSTTIYSTYTGSPSLGTAIFVQVKNPSNGAVLVARTNGGIREDVSGVYGYSTTISTGLDAYEIIWDQNDGFYVGETYVPRPDVTVNVTSGSPLPLTGDANADILGRTFLIKRNDTKPYLRRQLVDTNGNAVTLGSADTVMFTMRASTDTAMAGSAKTHGTAVIVDATQGIVEYHWAAADTNTTTWTETSLLGKIADVPYAGEFEVTSASDSTIETFPQDGYIAISIPPDLDPGVNP